MLYVLRIILRGMVFPLSLLFTGCNTSPLSTGGVVDPSLLRVNVLISRSVSYGGHVNESIEAYIRDKNNKTVANHEIQIKVNGKPLWLNNGSSNYYGAYPYYQLVDSSLEVEADATYTVTVVLTDGKEYSLGTIQTQPELTPASFSPPIKHSKRQPLRLQWQDLEPHNWFVTQWKKWQGERSVTELKIMKSSMLVDKWGSVQYEQGSADEADYLNTTVGSGEGAYTIPESYFEGPLPSFNTLDLFIDSEKNVDADGAFLEGSALTSSRRGIYRVTITD
jgi:hypothetical protein